MNKSDDGLSELSSCSPALRIVLSHLPIKQWLQMRRLSSTWLECIDRSLKGVKELRGGAQCPYFEKLRRFLRTQCPQIQGLCLPLSASQLLGFENLRKIEIHLTEKGEFLSLCGYLERNTKVESLTIVWITDTEISEILELLPPSSLTTLDMEQVEYPQDTWTSSPQLLSTEFPAKFPILQNLILPAKMFYPREGIVKDLLILQHCRNLGKLGMPKILNSHNFHNIILALLPIWNLQSLVFPALSSNEISLLSRLTSRIKINDQMKSLRFCDRNPNQGNPEIAANVVDIVSEVESLRDLTLDSILNLESVWDLEKLTKLESLTLTRLAATAIFPICQELLNKSLPSLRELHLNCKDWEGFETEGVIALDRELDSLKIDITHCKGPIRFACGEKLKKSLKSLEVIRRGSTETLDFLGGLFHGCTSLQFLDISQCFGCHAETIQCIQNCAPQLRVLIRQREMFQDLHASFL